MKHYELQPAIWFEKPLVFDWDIETGAVSGPDAARILNMASWPMVEAHPLPWVWILGPEPTKSLTDMAAILGWAHRLPEDLQAHYPRPADDGEDVDEEPGDFPSVEPVN